MSSRLPSVDWTWWGKITAAFLLFVVTGAGLVFVFSPIFDLGWIGKPPSEKVSFYVTGVGVPLLTFAGFLAVLLGFLSQERQNAQQEEHFQKDRFESTFFQLLRTHNQIAEGVSWRRGSTRFLSGRIGFKEFYSDFDCNLKRKYKNEEWGESKNNEEVEKRVREVYMSLFESDKYHLSPYYNNLSKTISFVEERATGDKHFYIDLVIAQMSLTELRLFFYHEVATRQGSEAPYLDNVRGLLKKYTFFRQIEPTSLCRERHAELNKEALGVD